jgi:5-methylcytosine-specific restriction endonuclease McrA
LDRKEYLQLKRDRKRIKRCQKYYSDRSAALSSIGFASYKEYLNSALWARIRLEVLNQSTTCHACTNIPTQVHHTLYTADALLGKDLSKLYPVCSRCHFAAEFADPKGKKKRDPKRATQSLNSRAKSVEKKCNKLFDESWENDI